MEVVFSTSHCYPQITLVFLTFGLVINQPLFIVGLYRQDNMFHNQTLQSHLILL